LKGGEGVRTTIYEGANDVQRLTIAKSLLRALSAPGGPSIERSPRRNLSPAERYD